MKALYCLKTVHHQLDAELAGEVAVVVSFAGTPSNPVGRGHGHAVYAPAMTKAMAADVPL